MSDVALARAHQPRSGRLAAAVRSGVESTWRPALLLVALGCVWAIVTNLGWVKPYLLPTPQDVASTIGGEPGFLWRNTLSTLWETVAGFGLAASLGLFAAVAIVYSNTVEKTLYPLLLFAQVVPKAAIAPLFVVWLGVGNLPKILVALLVAFFPVVVSGVTGLRSIDPTLLELSATMGASQADTFRKLRLPAALPHLFSGLKVAATLAVVGAVIGEFVGSNRGLGYVLLTANGNLNTPLLYAGLVVLSAMGIVIFLALELSERLLIPWHASRRPDLSASA